MAEVRLSVAAQIDFDELIDYLAEVAGKATAAKYAQQIQAQINLISDFPGLGAPRSELGAITRMISVDPYLIFYDGRPRSRRVRVLRILPRPSQCHSRADRSGSREVTASRRQAANIILIACVARDSIGAGTATIASPMETARRRRPATRRLASFAYNG
jgi:plasmid stabilization system protein ParE